jgi:hypothetical protein
MTGKFSGSASIAVIMNGLAGNELLGLGDSPAVRREARDLHPLVLGALQGKLPLTQ